MSHLDILEGSAAPAAANAAVWKPAEPASVPQETVAAKPAEQTPASPAPESKESYVTYHGDLCLFYYIFS